MSRPVRSWGLLLSLLAILLAGVMGASGARALIVSAGNAQISYKPTANSSGSTQPLTKQQATAVGPLEYFGGPVMPSNTNYAVFWAPGGASAYPSGYTSGIDRYFEDLAHDSGGIQNTDSILAQYGDSSGHHAEYLSRFGGPLFDTHAYPANGCSQAPTCLTDAQLRSELTRLIGELHLPTDLEHEYFLLTPAGVESCLEAAGHACSAGSKKPVYCAYHTYISAGGGPLVYANTPYLDGTNCDTGEEHPNGNPSDATLGGGLVHEHSESVTDPELNAWHDSKEDEVADKCRTHKAATEFGEPLGKAPNGANYNEVIDGDLYWYQQMWSNEAGGCVQRAAPSPPTVKKVKPKSGPAGGGTSITVIGANFVGPVSVLFGATPATQVEVVSATTITAVSPPGTGTVDVTVQTSAGTSPVVKADRFKYKKERKA